ncbi:transposase, partial [Pseudomonas aeruginosa]
GRGPNTSSTRCRADSAMRRAPQLGHSPRFLQEYATSLSFLRCIELPEAMADWSLTSLQLKLIKIGARVVRHARAITFQLAEVAVTGPMVRAVLAAIRRLRTPPSCA